MGLKGVLLPLSTTYLFGVMHNRKPSVRDGNTETEALDVVNALTLTVIPWNYTQQSIYILSLIQCSS